VGLFTAIATLGLDGIVVRELVRDESRRDELIGTAFWLKLTDSSRLYCLGWQHKMEFEDGIIKAMHGYLNNKGVKIR
jgi:nucleoside-diphosphate-sugar epimerase